MVCVSTIVSGIASLGVLIGFITGIFFLVLTGLKWVSRVRASLYEEELNRRKKFLLNESYLIGTSSSSFTETGKEENDFESSFYQKNLQKNTDKNYQSCITTETDWNERDKEKSKVEDTIIPSTVQVREFIEKLVETLIEGPLDGITVGKLSNHPAYLAIFTKYHSLLCQELARLGLALHLSVVRKNDLPDPSHSNLKRLLKQIVSEAMALPNIKDILNSPKLSKDTFIDDFKNKSYEDILATAILNKVIEKFQKKNEVENETVTGNNKSGNNKEKFIGNEDDDDLTSNSDWSYSSRSDKLSLTIEEYIEEVTTNFELSDDERCKNSGFETLVNRRVPFPESGRTVRDVGTDDEDINNDSDVDEQSSATELITSTSSWEENWLFQKKRLRSTPNAHHPVPVPMLVPNPSEDFRALVGGVDADDLSDMSDCSDLILEDLNTTEEVLVLHETQQHQDTHDDSEKEKVYDNQREEELRNSNDGITTDDIKEETLKIKTLERNEKDTSDSEVVCEVDGEGRVVKANEVLNNPSSLTSQEILSQKDRELSVEDFNLLHQCESTKTQTCFQELDTTSVNNEEDESIPRCRIAEREKEKWNNPVQLRENPYSLESIEKRERQNKIDYFRSGKHTRNYIDFPDDLSLDEYTPLNKETLRITRDYYINASKYSSGMPSSSPLKKLSHGNDQVSSSRESGEIIPETLKKFNIQEQKAKEESSTMQDKMNGPPKTRILSKSEFTLPNVKELAKQFATESPKPSIRSNNKILSNIETEMNLESKHKRRPIPTHLTLSEKEEFEIDYSTIPVSEIIFNLQNNSDSQTQKKNHKHAMHIETAPKTIMDIFPKSNSNFSVVNQAEKVTRKPERSEGVRFSGKQVHSLTARSISKEFREGLRNNSYQKLFAKVDRCSSGGESDQGEVISNKGNISPTPSTDLQNMKKFWEEIITANSNSIKHK